MGTKNSPGQYDCYANAELDEPMFVLLGRDPTASIVVEFWRLLKIQMRENGTSKTSDGKLEEARQCSVALEKWAKDHGKDPKEARDAFVQVLVREQER